MSAEIAVLLVRANIVVALAILLMIVARRQVRRLFGARLTYAAWLAVPFAVAASLLPARPVESGPALLRPLTEQAVQYVVTVGDPTGIQFDWLFLAITVWVAGTFVAGILILRLQRRTLSLIGPLDRVGQRCWRARSGAIGPATIGVFVPRIVLPADFERRFDEEQRAIILAHEGVHLAGHDVRINAAIAALRCVFWFNPLVHIAAPLVREDQELACDATVVARYPKLRRAYAETLLKTQTTFTPLPLGCYWPTRTPQRLKERIIMLTLKSPGPNRRAVGATLVALAIAGLGYAAWANEPGPISMTNSGPGPEAMPVSRPPGVFTKAPLPTVFVSVPVSQPIEVPPASSGPAMPAPKPLFEETAPGAPSQAGFAVQGPSSSFGPSNVVKISCASRGGSLVNCNATGGNEAERAEAMAKFERDRVFWSSVATPDKQVNIVFIPKAGNGVD